jgi:hypothetical protein
MEGTPMRIIALPLLLVLAASQAGAAEAQRSRRYVFVPVEAGTLRLDTATGEVSLCTAAAGQPACALVPDEGRAGGDPVLALQDRVAALEARLAALEERSRTSEFLADEESLDRVMVLADRMIRHFFGIVREIKREMEGEQL